MKHAILLMLFAGVFHSVASARVINVPSCSQDDFEHAVYVDAVPGDVLVLPAGAATWGKSSRNNEGVIYIINNITVLGQGDSTVITLDDTGKTYATGVIACWAAATFAHFKIIGSSAAPVSAFNISPFNNTTTGINFTGGFRLTDITYVGGSGPSADAYFAYVSTGVDYGVIDNCRITGNSGGAELVFGRGPGNAWQLNTPVGTSKNIFIEDCIFNNTGYVCDANSNASFVVRYNTINGANKVDGHGVASNSPPRSFRSLEVYRNRWTGGGNSATAIEIRGGTAMIFDNTSAFTGGTSAGDRFFLTDYGYQGIWRNLGVGIVNAAPGGATTTITTSTAHGYVTGAYIGVYCPTTTPQISNFYTLTVTSPTTFTIPFTITAGGALPTDTSYTVLYLTPLDYPLADQVGVGKDPKVAASEPAYIINNLKNGAPWGRTFSPIAADALVAYQIRSGNPTATFTDADVIKSNRDFFADAGFDANTGASRGTKAAMLAFNPGSVVGYGWWVTDEGSWNTKIPANTSGQLYTWNGTSWVLKYTPFTYPHPLRLPIPASNLRLNP